MDDTMRKFLEPGPIAVVGASDSSRKFGGQILKVLKERGYRVYAVNHHAATVGGEKAYVSLNEVPAEVEAAVIAVRPENASGVVAEAARRGIKRLWFQQGANFSAAVAEAKAAGIETVSGKCILMYASPVTGIHKFHQTLARIFGKY